MFSSVPLHLTSSKKIGPVPTPNSTVESFPYTGSVTVCARKAQYISYMYVCVSLVHNSNTRYAI